MVTGAGECSRWWWVSGGPQGTRRGRVLYFGARAHARAPLRTYHADVVVDGGGMMTGVGQVDVMFGHGADVDLCVVLSLSWWWWCRSGSDTGLTG